jgi:hypothetical protein
LDDCAVYDFNDVILRFSLYGWDGIIMIERDLMNEKACFYRGLCADLRQGATQLKAWDIRDPEGTALRRNMTASD